MQPNLIFLSGPHGSGKTTLLNILLKDIPFSMSPELETRTLKFDIEPKERLILKVCQRSLENYEYLDISDKNPGRLILGNRCIYDQQAYNAAYCLMGWISKDELETCNQLAENFYINSLKEPYAIVLNPPLEKIKEHLERRWAEKGKKWREGDMGYLKIVNDVYKMFRDKEKIFYIDKEIDLKTKKEVCEIAEWVKDISEEHKRNSIGELKVEMTSTF